MIPKKINSSLLLIFFIPTLLVSVWFWDGNIMGTAESGLPFYNFQIAYDSYKDAWADYTLGYPTNIGVGAKPTYLALSQLQNLGLPGFILQAAFFWIVFVISGVSVAAITKLLFPKLGDKFLILAVLFYWFNPFSLVNTWNRFLNNYLVFYALLPLCLYLVIKGLHTKKYLYAILVGIACGFFSYALTSIAFVIILWIVIGLTLAINFLLNKQDRLFIVKFFFLCLTFWVLINSWWVFQVFSYVNLGSFQTVASTAFTGDNNYWTFTVLSERLGSLIDVFRLRHNSFFLDKEIGWNKIYQFPVIILFEFIIFSFCLIPIIFKRSQGVLFLSGSFLLATILTKGNNLPFGEVWDNLFLNFSFLQIFRNPFEKFGFSLSLVLTPLFALGVSITLAIFKEKLAKIGYLLIFVWLIVVWGYPFFSGLVFTDNDPGIENSPNGYKVEVPTDYKQAGEWLKTQPQDSRLVVFPLGKEGITYNWEKAYSGAEISNQLLPATSLSLITNIPYYADISNNTEELFMKGINFSKLMSILNAEYIMSRSDIDWHAREMRDPQTISNKLSQNSDFKNVANFGQLSFWAKSNPETLGKIYPADQVLMVYPQTEISDLVFADSENLILNTPVNNFSADYISKELVHPNAVFYLTHGQEPFFEWQDNIFPHIRYSPSSSFYKLILAKEEFEERLVKKQSDLFWTALQRLGKRLAEVNAEFIRGDTKAAEIAIDKYSDLIIKYQQLFSQMAHLMKVASQEPFEHDQFLDKEDIYTIYWKHKIALGKLQDQYKNNSLMLDKLQGTEMLLTDTFSKAKIIPKFNYKVSDNFQIKRRQIYQLDIKTEGDYEILWGDKTSDHYYDINLDKEEMFQVDSELISRKPQITTNGKLSYGKIKLSPGIHEISWNTPVEKNLVTVEVPFTLSGKDSFKLFPIKKFDPYSSYTITVEYLTKRGSGPEVSIETNNSKIKNGKTIPAYFKPLSPDQYEFEKKIFTSAFRTPNTADTANLVVKVEPWNNCEIVHKEIKDKCVDEEFRKPFNKTTEVVIEKVSVARILNDRPVLIKENQLPINNSSPDITYSKINNAEYSVKITGAKEPFMLVFSELFDAGWNLSLTNGESIGSNHLLANGFSNSWFIDKKGDYELKLKFAPQQLLVFSEKISLAAFIIGVGYVSWEIKKGKRNV